MCQGLENMFLQYHNSLYIDIFKSEIDKTPGSYCLEVHLFATYIAELYIQYPTFNKITHMNPHKCISGN